MGISPFVSLTPISARPRVDARTMQELDGTDVMILQQGSLTPITSDRSLKTSGTDVLYRTF